MPVSRKRKSSRTGRPATTRPLPADTLLSVARRLNLRPKHEHLMASAIREGLARETDVERLKVLYFSGPSGCIAWLDVLAADNPDDARLDAWREYRGES